MSARTHGLSKHPLYRKWQDILQRCYNTQSRIFKYYGGRGVVICDEWKRDVKAFVEWALENGWEPGKEIDKDLKVPGNLVYSPETCTIVNHAENMSMVVSRKSGRKTSKMKLLECDVATIINKKEIGISTQELAFEYEVNIATINRVYRAHKQKSNP